MRRAAAVQEHAESLSCVSPIETAGLAELRCQLIACSGTLENWGNCGHGQKIPAQERYIAHPDFQSADESILFA